MNSKFLRLDILLPEAFLIIVVSDYELDNLGQPIPEDWAASPVWRLLKRPRSQENQMWDLRRNCSSWD